MDLDSFNEHLDGRALAYIKTLRRRLVESISGHADGTYLSRDWSRSNGFASFSCCGRKVSSSFLTLVGEISRLVIYDQPADHQRGGGASKLRDGNFDLFIEAQHAETDCLGTHRF